MMDASPKSPISTPRPTPPLVPPAVGYDEGVKFGLLVVFLLIILAASIAAASDIETIIGFGAVVAVLGLILAFVPFRGDRRLRWIGISAPVFAAAVLATIFHLEWSPSEAQVPVGIAILAYQWLVVCGGIYAAARAWLGDDPQRFQFGLRTLFAVTLLVAVVAGLVRLGLAPRNDETHYLKPASVGSFVLLCAAAIYAVGYVNRQRRQATESALSQATPAKGILPRP